MSSIKDIEKLIQLYLYQRGVVSIPGVGTFKIERVRPKDSDSGKYLWGPVHVVKLDSKIDSNGKEIFDYVSKKMNISEWEAIKLVNEFVTNLKSSVRKDSKYHLEGLGNFEINEDGSFKLNAPTLQYPFYSRILKPDAGFKQSTEETDLDSIESDSEPIESFEYPEEKIQKDKWWIAVLVFAVLSILFILISLTRSDIPFGGRQNRSDVQVAPIQYE